MLDWFSWSNLLYFLVLLLGTILAVVSAKWRNVFTQLKELAETLERAYSDKKLTNAERREIIKESLDVLKALIGIKFKVFGK